MQLVAVPIAAALTFLALLLLVRQYFRQPTFWILVALGYIAAYIAQWTGRTVWDPLTFDLGIPQAGAGIVVNMLGRAFLAEAFKFAPVLVIGLMTEMSSRDWFAYGAAAGAGFGFFVSQQLIAFSLEVYRLSLSTPALTLLTVLLKFFPILAQTATTAFVAWAVCFDVGGTLLHMDPPPEVIFADLCRDLGVEIAPAAAARAYAHSETWFNAHRDLYTRAPEEFWRRGNRVLLERLGVRDELDARAAFITEEFSKRAGGWSVYPEVPEVLAALQARGLPLAVVSNWDPGLSGLLERLGLRAAFRVVIGSADAGVAQPDPPNFVLATAPPGGGPAQTGHVGGLD